MSGVQTAAGTTLYVSAVKPATFNAAGYAALTWTKVGEVTDLGSHGRTYADVTHKPIDNRSTQHLKGSFDEGTKTLNLAVDTTDPGQVIMKTALKDDADYYFKQEWQDGDIDYFSGKVMSYPVSATGVDTIRSASVTIGLTTTKTGVGIIEVPNTTP